MNCPSCGSKKRQEVKETRTGQDGRITRRRRCPACGTDFRTIEQLSDTDLMVKKSDGRLVGFKRETVRRSMVEAAVRKYDPERINALIDSVVADIFPLAQSGVVSSSVIADSVLRHFGEIDKVSQIRFALVHLGRTDRNDGIGAGWSAVDDVWQWLSANYPELRYAPLQARLSHVVKRDGSREQFDRSKMIRGLKVAAKGRGNSEQVAMLANRVAAQVEKSLGNQPLVTTGQLAAEILSVLRKLDHIAYLRFASTVKRFNDPKDYEEEVEALRRESS